MQDAVVRQVAFVPKLRLFNVEVTMSVTTKKLKMIARRLKASPIVTKVHFRKGHIDFEVESENHREKGFELLFNIIQQVLRRPKPRRKVREHKLNVSKQHKTTPVVARR